MKAASVVGVSYRRLDYWARCGYLRPANEGRGSGAWRVWPERELAIAQLMARLIDAGLTLATAAGASRALVDAVPVRLDLGCGYAYELAPGVYLAFGDAAS